MISTRLFERVVVGYDASALADTALLQSIAIAAQYGGEIVAVFASESAPPLAFRLPTSTGPRARGGDPIFRALDTDCRRVFAKLNERAETAAVPLTVEFVQHTAADGILDAANRWKASAIAVGAHGRTGVARVLSGSVVDTVLRIAGIPVIVTRDGPVRDRIRRIVLGLDASEPAARAGVFAVSLSIARQVRLTICTVTDTVSLTQPNADLSFDPDPLLSELRRAARDALDSVVQYANGLGAYPDTEVIEAVDVGKALCQAAIRHDADILVIGNHRRGSIGRLFIGSTAGTVIRHADRPVIIVPPQVHVASRPASRVRTAT